ncbi:hypothetical protein JCM10212_003295 [Sporobolomyces blumeae]
MATPTSTSPTDAAPLAPRTSLSIDEIGNANRRAQLDGFLSGFMSTRAFKMSRNTGLLSGLLSGVVVGYIFTQESLKIQLSKAEKSRVDLNRHLDPSSAPIASSTSGAGFKAWGNDMSLREDGNKEVMWDLSKGERGSGGMEEFHDKYASTRGDH